MAPVEPPLPLPAGSITFKVFLKLIAGGPAATPAETVTAGVFNLLIEPGTTYERLFQAVDKDDVAIDLTGFDIIRSELRDKYIQDGGVVIATTITAYDNQVLGKIDFEVSAAETAKLTEQQGVWDLEIEDTSVPPKVLRLMEGCWVRLTPQVTD